jgi:hypothetical protein
MGLVVKVSMGKSLPTRISNSNILGKYNNTGRKMYDTGRICQCELTTFLIVQVFSAWPILVKTPTAVNVSLERFACCVAISVS